MIRKTFNGHSGCKVWREGDTVYKECAPSYAERLQEQVLLTQRYAEEFGEVVFVPQMQSVSPTRVSMEYVPWLGWLDFVEQADYAVMGKAIDNICVLARVELQQTTLDEVSSSVWQARLARLDTRIRRVSEAVREEYFVQMLRLGALIISQPSWSLPVGMCHGDLTCSNLLFHPKTGAIAAVDVLDCSPMTPLWDVAKLKQDARFHWTLFGASSYENTVKVQFCDHWLARRIAEELQPALENPLLRVLEAFNYLRIVPYAQTAGVHRWLHNALDYTLTGEIK